MLAVPCACPGICGLHEEDCENLAVHTHESEFMVDGHPSGMKYTTGICDECWKAWEEAHPKAEAAQ
jgi:hypothetical protein